MTTNKQCSKCKQLLPLEDFSPRSASKDGKQFACKPCMRQYNLSYYHKERKGESGSDFTPAYITLRSSGYNQQAIADYYHTHSLSETQQIYALSAYQIRLCYQKFYGQKPTKAQQHAPQGMTPLEKKLRRMEGKTYVYNCQFVRIKGFEVDDQRVILQTDRHPLPLPLKKINWVLEREFLPMEL